MPASQARKRKAPRLSRTHRPAHLSVREWQLGLRRQYAREQPLKIRKLGREPVFSEFSVTNPQTKRTYRVVIRGDSPGVNYCSCPDYAVNTLGLCKHIEVVLLRLRRGHRQLLQQGYQPEFPEVYVRYGSRREIVLSPGRSNAPALRKLARHYFEDDGTLRADAPARFDQFIRDAARLKLDVRVYDDALEMIAEIRDTAVRSDRLRARYGDLKSPAWRHLLKVPLYPYQRKGALFGAVAGRAVIADDMGLGKTIQAIAAAEILARECGLERVLIVCPTSLKSQWQHEIGQFSGRKATIIEGLTHNRRLLYERDDAFFKIVNYDVVHRDLEGIAAWAPDLVILDEAQRIKNWQTRAAKTVKRIGSRHALVLTGTPLENRLDELHSIVEFVDRHRLGPLFAFKAAHEICEEGSSRVVGYQGLKQIGTTLAPILIRRTKQEVLKQLPPRMDKNFFVPMTGQQLVHHDENREIVARLVAKWRRYKFLTESDQIRLRVALQRMRMSCDSTYLVDHASRHHTKLGELATLLAEIFEDPAAKVVIFSQWLRMTELVEELLQQRRWGYVHLHGGVPGRERKELTRALREERACRVFLSTDAGGVGLNLQSASAVINMDLPWNPAVLEQRIGRVHRLGQSRPVRVVNFVSEGTIEHGMLSLLAFKQSMFAGVLDGESDRVFMGEGAMARFMKTVETATSSIPQVTPTPLEPEPTPAAAEEGRHDRADESGQPALDVVALGEVLTRGASLLQELGRSLAAGQASQRGGGLPLLAQGTDGRPELRIPLPNSEVLAEWASAAGRLVQLLMPQPPRL